MGFRALFRGATSSAIPKEVRFDLASETIPSLSEGQEYRSKRGRMRALRGSWGNVAGATKMESTTTSSSYPITAIDGLTKNAIVDITDMGQGVSAALWVTDANNWWAVGTYQQPENCNCSTYYYSCNCSTYYYDCNCSTSCPGGFYTKYVCSGRYVNGYCYGYYYQACSGGYVYSCSTCSSTSCSTCSGQSCSTCYPQYLRILQSVAGSVSTIVSYAISAVIRSMRVTTSNKSITVDTFSDANLATPITTNTYNATTATETTNFGIMMAPSSYNESKTLSSIKLRRNR